MKLFLISGIPGCGKTVFGDWLEKNHGFTHIDIESFNGTEHHKKWDEALGRGNLGLFVQYLRTLSDKVVLSWGYNLSHFGIVKALQAAGIECWWFDAPEMIARDSFLKRNTVSETNFNVQIEAIRTNQKQLLEFYQNRICVVMLGRSVYRDRADICREMNIV